MFDSIALIYFRFRLRRSKIRYGHWLNKLESINVLRDNRSWTYQEELKEAMFKTGEFKVKTEVYQEAINRITHKNDTGGIL